MEHLLLSAADGYPPCSLLKQLICCYSVFILISVSRGSHGSKPELMSLIFFDNKKKKTFHFSAAVSPYSHSVTDTNLWVRVVHENSGGGTLNIYLCRTSAVQNYSIIGKCSSLETKVPMYYLITIV